MKAATQIFLDAVRDERLRQDEKWGEQDHDPVVWMAILLEEVGEAAQAMLENRQGEYEHELIQVAAVACVTWESFLRRQQGALVSSSLKKAQELQRITPFEKGDKDRRNE